MPTLMSRTTFDSLRRIRNDMETMEGLPARPSYVFVPWAGERLVAERRGLYIVGIAGGAQEGRGDVQFEDALKESDGYWDKPHDGGSFLDFINDLTATLLDGPYRETQQAWGWSNLLKIGGNKDSSSVWADELAKYQRDACITALREELAPLRQSLVVIASRDGYGILHESIADESRWDRTDRPGRTFLFHDTETGNAFVHCYHPRPMRTHGWWNDTLAETVSYARKNLPSLSAA